MSKYSVSPSGERTFTLVFVNAHKTEYMCSNQTGDIFTLDGAPLKLVDKFTYVGSSVASTEKDIDTRLTKPWTAINRLSIIWKSDLTDKMKRSFFRAAVVSILLYGCTTWTLTKRLEKKLDGNYTRMLRTILNKSWRQHPTRHQLYGHLPPIMKTIQVRRTRHAGHCWRSRDELISDVLQWTPTYGLVKAGRPARTYIQQLCEDTGCSPEDLPEAMNDREKWREMIRDIRASGMTWWWWNELITRDRNPDVGSCNCRSKEKCPLGGRCNSRNVVYQARISPIEHKRDGERVYIGISAGNWKQRYYNHRHSFSNPKLRYQIVLSKYLGGLKDQGLSPQIKWKIIRHSSTANSFNGRCNLCLDEKISIINFKNRKLRLNERNELVFKCRHRGNFKLSWLSATERPVPM